MCRSISRCSNSCPNCVKNNEIESAYIQAHEDLVDVAVAEFEGLNIEDQLEEFNHGFENFLGQNKYKELTKTQKRRLFSELERIME